VETLLKSTSRYARVTLDPERFSGLHHRSAIVMGTSPGSCICGLQSAADKYNLRFAPIRVTTVDRGR
jgi:hypothetical protein